MWTVDTGATKAVSEVFGVTGAATSPAAGYTGVNVASSISIDGAGTAWIANCRVGCAGSGSTAADNVVHLSATGTSLTPTSDGYQNLAFAQPSGTAIDISGNLWITNTSGASVTELVGVAVPVVNELETASSRHALPAVNYLRNPSFELGTGAPAAWTVNSTAAGSTNEDTGSPFSGQQKLAVYRELLKTYKPQHIGIYGSSAGAILTAEVTVKLRLLGLPLPAVTGIFSGDGDPANAGDSTVLYGLNGFAGHHEVPSADTALLNPYIGSTDPRDSVLSPLYADLHGFPPTLFVSSGRDLLLSATTVLHRAYLRAGVDAQLVVFEALPHTFWNEFNLPESQEALRLMASFLGKHL